VARLGHNGEQDDFDDIFGVATASTRAWMTRQALLADSTRPGLPLLPLARLQNVLWCFYRDFGSSGPLQRPANLFI